MEDLTLAQRQEFLHILKNKQALENTIFNPVSRFDSSIPLFKHHSDQLKNNDHSQAEKIKESINTFIAKEDIQFRYQTALTYAHLNHLSFEENAWHDEAVKKGISLQKIRQNFEDEKLLIVQNIDLNKDSNMTLNNLKSVFKESQSYFLATHNTFIEKQNLLNAVASISGLQQDISMSLASSQKLSDKLKEVFENQHNHTEPSYKNKQ